MELRFGLSAPLGFVGLAIDGSPFPFLGLNAGVGLGAQGVQYAASGRIRPFRFGHTVHIAPYLGGGGSAGPYAQYDTSGILDGDPVTLQYQWDMAIWGNLEAGVDMRLTPQFSLRPCLGSGPLPTSSTPSRSTTVRVP